MRTLLLVPLAALLVVPALAVPAPSGALLLGQVPVALAGRAALPSDLLALSVPPRAWQDLLAWNEAHLVGTALPEVAAPPPLAPSAGLRAVLVAQGRDPSLLDARAARAYDAMPAADRDALGRLLHAYLDEAGAARGATFTPAGIGPADAALLFRAQRELLAAAQAAVPLFRQDATQLAGLPPVEVCGALVVDFTITDNVRACDVGFLLDAGGDDTYLNNAGGSGPPPPATGGVAGFALDLTGNDTYVGHSSSAGFTGGALIGAGLLIDAAGDDVYAPSADLSGAMQGGANEGIGMLLDLAGNDRYGGAIGTTPEFHASGGGINGGAVAGSGLLVDLAGDDAYGGAITGAGGVNGGTHGGVGTLLDYAGNDSYGGSDGDLGGVNGGAVSGTGLLLDAAGDDGYNGSVGTNGGVNGGAWIGNGNLVDLAGNDTYDGYVAYVGGVNGGCFDSGATHGFLFDGGGDDAFTGAVGTEGGVNGAGFFCEGELVDVGGNDTYETHNAPGLLREANGEDFLGNGLLLDIGGTDYYRDHTTDPWVKDETARVGGGPAATGFRIDLDPPRPVP